MKVYVVTKGYYSDYHIVAIFDNKKAAQNCAFNHGEDGMLTDSDEMDTAVEEWEVNSKQKREIPRWQVCINREGSTSIGRIPTDDSYYLKDGYFSFHSVSYSGVDGPHLVLGVTAPDAPHAVKIANEKRSAFIAAGYWDHPWAHPNYTTDTIGGPSLIL